VATLSREIIEKMGFLSIGQNVHVSDRVSFYNTASISLGNNVRIDDFCVLSAGAGGIFLGDYVHIAVYSSLMGAGKISLFDFSGLSSRVSIYSSNDDYSGKMMTNPTVPSRFTGVNHADVTLEKHVIIGTCSIILPGVTLHEGVAVGALSLINNDCEAFGIYVGTPAKRIGNRKRDLLEIEKEMRQSTLTKDQNK